MTENIEANISETSTSLAPAQKKKNKALPIIAVILVIAVAAGLVFGLSSGKGSSAVDPIFYIENDILYMKDLNNLKKPVVNVCNVEGDTGFGTSIRMKNDGSEIFFTFSEETEDSDDDIIMTLGTYNTLYRYNLTTPDVAPVKIAEKVIDYTYDEANDIIYCISGEESILSQIDANGTTELNKGIHTFTLSTDGQSFIYEFKDGGVYYKAKDKDAVTLSEKGLLVNHDDALTYFHILEDGKLSKATADGKKELIDSDVYSASFLSEKGYYYKETKSFNLKNLFEDDMAESDNEIKIPADDSDEEAYELYTERLARDEIRSFILDPEQTFSVQDVYYFNGTEGKKVLENALNADFSDVAGAENESVNALFCSVVDLENFEKIKMSDIWALIENMEDDDFDYSILEKAYDLISDPFVKYSTDYFVLEDKFAQPTNINGIVYDVIFDETNNVLYLTAEKEEASDLYRFSISDEGLSEAELMKENVSVYDAQLTESGKLLYLEEIEIEEYEYYYNVYLDSELIAENACYLSNYDFDTDTIILEVYQLAEDGSVDFEGDTTQLYYNLETGKKTELKPGVTYYTYTSSSEKNIIIEEHDDMETYSVLILEDGVLTDTELDVPYPEAIYPMDNYRQCYNYTLDDFKW